jgi:hypothetical protein
LDKIEASSRHISQNILPCVKVFDHESVKKAIDSITSHQGQEVIFAGTEVIKTHFLFKAMPFSFAPTLTNRFHLLLHSCLQFLLKEIVHPEHNVPKSKVHHTNHTNNKISDPSSSKVPGRAAIKIKSRSTIGPVEFSNIMRQKYPNMVRHHTETLISYL